MKTKFMKRFSSAILALVMLVMLAVPAYAAGSMPVSWEVSGGMGGPRVPDVVIEATNCPESPTSVSVGETINIPWPSTTSVTEYNTKEDYSRVWEFTNVTVMYMDTDNNLQQSTLDSAEECAAFVVPDNINETLGLNIAYIWEAGDTTQGRPVITNFIFDVDRTVAQNDSNLTAAQDESGTDVYQVVNRDKSGLSLTYNTSMDMTNLGFAFNYGDGSWELLQANKKYITNDTWVDLHFVFDEEIDMDTLNTDNAKLISDMFVLRNDVETFEKNEHELIVHCRWDSDKAMADADLDPMIYFNGVKVDLPDDWGEADSITIANSGKVNGWVYAYGDGGRVNLDMEINGGDTVDTFILTLKDKIRLPGMDKTIVLEDGTEVDKDNVAAGDTVKFQLESNVPENLEDYVDYTPDDPVIVPNSIGDAGTYTLVFHDEMAEELALNEDSIQVKLGDAEIDDQYVTISYDPADDCTFEVSVNLAAMYNNDAIDESDFGVTPITVNYTATLHEAEVAGAYTNTAWVVYPDGNSQESTVTVYTYGIDIFKYDQGKGLDAADAGLDGAEFALYGAEDVTVADDGTVTVNGDAEAIETVASANGGHATIGGLDEGTYYLVETKAPDGYVKSDTPLKIVIPEDADGTTYMVDVNFANTLIPHTGGMGTTMFTLGGAAILAAAGVLFIYSRKTRKDQEEN